MTQAGFANHVTYLVSTTTCLFICATLLDDIDDLPLHLSDTVMRGSMYHDICLHVAHSSTSLLSDMIFILSHHFIF